MFLLNQFSHYIRLMIKFTVRLLSFYQFTDFEINFSDHVYWIEYFLKGSLVCMRCKMMSLLNYLNSIPFGAQLPFAIHWLKFTPYELELLLTVSIAIPVSSLKPRAILLGGVLMV